MWPKNCDFPCPDLAWQLHIAMALPSKCAHHGTPATVYCAMQCNVFLKILELGAIKCHKIQHPIHHWVLEIFQIWAWHKNLEMAQKRQRIKWAKVVESVRGRSEREGRSEDKEGLELSKNWEAVGSCPFLKRQLLNRLPVWGAVRNLAHWRHYKQMTLVALWQKVPHSPAFGHIMNGCQTSSCIDLMLLQTRHTVLGQDFCNALLTEPLTLPSRLVGDHNKLAGTIGYTHAIRAVTPSMHF